MTAIILSFLKFRISTGTWDLFWNFIFVYHLHLFSLPILDDELSSLIGIYEVKVILEVREESIRTIDIEFHSREYDTICESLTEELIIDLRSSADEGFFLPLALQILYELIDICERCDSLMSELTAGEDDILTSWKRTTDRLKSPTPHDNRRA